MRAETLAHALASHPDAQRRGRQNLDLTLYEAEGPRVVRHPIDPATTPREEAEALRKSARKWRRQASILPERQQAILAELAEAEQARIALDSPITDRPTLRARERLLQTLQERLMPRGLWPVPPRKAETRPPSGPVRWNLEGGWILLAGRSGTENDFLTTRIARPGDLWFHVADVPGAHVVLRSPDGRDSSPPPPERIEQAASLAAWLSRLRAQDRVEVRFTERRRVRKPRKAPAGSVVMDQSRSLLVRPAPPPRQLPPLS